MIDHPRLCGRGPCFATSGREGVSDVVRKNTSTTSDCRTEASLRSVTGDAWTGTKLSCLVLGFVRPEDLIVFGGLTIHQTASYRFPDFPHGAPRSAPFPCVK